MKESLKKLLEKNWVAYSVATCSAVLLYVILTHIYMLRIIMGVLSPIFWGIVIAYLMNPLINLIESKPFGKIKKDKIRYGLSVMLAIIIALTGLVLLIMTIVPVIVDSISGIISNADSYITNYQLYLDDLSNAAMKYNIDISGITSASEQIVERIFSYLSDNMHIIADTFMGVGTGLANFLIGVVLAIYFMFDKKNLVSEINNLRRLVLKEKTYKVHNQFWARCHKILSRFFMFDIIEGIIVGTVNAIFMLIFGMPYVVLISVIIGVTNMLPTFGPIIGGLAGALILVLTNPMNGLIFLIFTVILQTFDGYILKPRMFGSSFGVPAVWVLVAIVLGGKLFGVVGILFAIPVAAIFTYILNEIIIPGLENKKAKGKE